MDFGVIRLLGIVGSICLLSSSLIQPVAVSSTTIALWMLAGISVPALAGLVSEVPAECALWFAPVEALGDVMIITMTYPTMCL